MKKAPLIFDGAMGTVIYDRGVFINTPPAAPTPTRHNPYGLGEKTEAITRAAVRLAGEAAGEEVFVAGSVGPCAESRQRMPDAFADEVEAAFRTQMEGLA